MARETQLNPSVGPVASAHSSRGVAGQSFAVNGTAGQGPAGTKLRKGIGEMLADAIELIELQVSLFKLNGHQAKEKALLPIAFFAAGGVLAMTALPILLVAIAFLIDELTVLNAWQSFGLTFVVAILLGGLAAYIGFRQLIALTKTFDDSTSELSRNFEWLKSSLRSSGNQEPLSERDRYQVELKEQWERKHSN